MSKKYIHYGSKFFDNDIFEYVINRECFNKPTGGLWASPVESPSISWYDWCIENDYCVEKLKTSFIFTLKPEAKILPLKNLEDVAVLPDEFFSPNFYDWNSFRKGYSGNRKDAMVYLNFEKIFIAGYDAIEYDVAQLYWNFYGWDVDSLLVLNPDCVVELD